MSSRRPFAELNEGSVQDQERQENVQRLHPEGRLYELSVLNAMDEWPIVENNLMDLLFFQPNDTPNADDYEDFEFGLDDGYDGDMVDLEEPFDFDNENDGMEDEYNPWGDEDENVVEDGEFDMEVDEVPEEDE